jgi:hypothetical protein
MKCSECGADLQYIRCSSCGGETPQYSKFCCNCGESLPIPVEDNRDEDDFSNRTLCSDGTCIGVIGPDGRCKECGKPYIGPAD